MYVYMYVCTYVGMYAYKYVYKCMYVYMCLYVCLYISMYIWMYVCMYVWFTPPHNHPSLHTAHITVPHCNAATSSHQHVTALYVCTAHITVPHCNAATSSHQHVTALYSRNQTYCSLLSFIPSMHPFLVRSVNYCNYCVMVHSSFALAWSLRPSARTVITR